MNYRTQCHSKRPLARPPFPNYTHVHEYVGNDFSFFQTYWNIPIQSYVIPATAFAPTKFPSSASRTGAIHPSPAPTAAKIRAPPQFHSPSHLKIHQYQRHHHCPFVQNLLPTTKIEKKISSQSLHLNATVVTLPFLPTGRKTVTQGQNIRVEGGTVTYVVATAEHTRPCLTGNQG